MAVQLLIQYYVWFLIILTLKRSKEIILCYKYYLMQSFMDIDFYVEAW